MMITYYSTNKKVSNVPFDKAVLSGIAGDGGLFFPDDIPALEADFINALPEQSISDMARRVLQPFFPGIPEPAFDRVINRTFAFDAPLVELEKNLYVLELFHGPTLAFKDFGARFLANTLAYLNKKHEKDTLILVATSGDTGSAVGHSFMDIEGVQVGLLYPSGKVSRIQEQQLTTMGDNIRAFEVEGTFDDCQRLVKQAFMQQELQSRFNLSSANSINIARFLPQSVYYFRAFAQLTSQDPAPVMVVPSGNFGNLTAGLIAHRMGLPVDRFIAAVNRNTVFPHYLETGEYQPHPSFKTYSNAMDVGDPSNFVRILELFNHDVETLRQSILSTSITDSDTLEGIRALEKRFGYVMDPHGAVGYMAWERLKNRIGKDLPVILFETAHPAKFLDIVKKAVDTPVSMPERLAACMDQPKKAIQIQPDLKKLTAELLAHYNA